MATLTFLDPSGSNLRSDVLSASSRKKLTPTSNNAPWIYCNYPERIGDGNKSWGIAENGYYINRQTVNGPAQIFTPTGIRLEKPFVIVFNSKITIPLSQLLLAVM